MARNDPTQPPGSGIDFAAVGALHIIDALMFRRAKPVVGVRSASAERAWQLPVDAERGDIVATVSGSDPVLLGPPMQVVRADESSCVVLQDRRFDHHVSISRQALRALLDSDSAAVWELLRLWNVDRCPRCAAPGRPLIYGLPAAPVAPWAVLAGCTVRPLAADMVCPKCDAQWRLPRSFAA